jgi:hypothetical protein
VEDSLWHPSRLLAFFTSSQDMGLRPRTYAQRSAAQRVQPTLLRRLRLDACIGTRLSSKQPTPFRRQSVSVLFPAVFQRRRQTAHASQRHSWRLPCISKTPHLRGAAAAGYVAPSFPGLSMRSTDSARGRNFSRSVSSSSSSLMAPRAMPTVTPSSGLAIT